MKKYMTSIKTLAALLIVGAAFSACSSSDSNIIDEPTPVTPTTKTYKLTVKATKGDDATRALSLSGNTLNALWAAGEKVYVYTANEITPGVYGPGESLICTLEATDVDGINCTLTGEIDPTGLSQGQKLYLQYRGGDKTGAVAPDQDGTIATISDFYDRAYAVVSITSIGTTITTGDADFTNQQAVVKFILQDNASSAISPDEITVTQTVGSAASDITVAGSTYTSNSNCFYIAFSQNTETGFSGDIDISATVGSDTYTYSKSSATFTAGKFYAVTVKMTKQSAAPTMFTTALTLEATASGKITVIDPIHSGGTPDKKMMYTKNGGTKIDLYNGSYQVDISVEAGDIVQFYGWKGADCYSGCKIRSNVDCYVYGNIMSLVDDDPDFATNTTLPGSGATFASLFKDNTHLKNSPDATKYLVLPATTLQPSCYREMFRGCTGLTAAPELPATTLTDQCYISMFSGCTGLTASPILRAPTLVSNCYNSMFYGCTGLTRITCLATNLGSEAGYWSAYSSIESWVGGITTTSGTFYKAASMNSWPNATVANDGSGIPEGWTVTNFVE